MPNRENAMTAREQSAMIAEWMGWRWWWNGSTVAKLKPPGWDAPPGWVGLTGGPPLDDWTALHALDDVPDFFSDLNAMAEAEGVVKERGLTIEYSTNLAYIVTEYDTLFLAGIFATAPQRAAALCRVIQEGER